MRRLCTLTLLLILCFAVSSLVVLVDAEPSWVEWSQTYGGEGSESANSLILTSDGGFALTGGSLLIKTDPYGVMEWNRTYASINAFSLIETWDRGYAMAGTTVTGYTEGTDFMLIKTDANGNLEWNQTYNGKYYDSAHSLVYAYGGYAIAGRTWDGSGDCDFWLVKTSGNGNMFWNQIYGKKGSVSDANVLVATSNGGFAMAGRTNHADFWLVRTDLFGNMLWNSTFRGDGSESCSSLVETSDGGFALAGSTTSFGAGKYDFWLVKTDSYGNMLWNRTYGGAEHDCAESLVITSDGGFALAGFTESFGAGDRDFWLVKTDAHGDMLLNQTYGGAELESASSLVATSDGGYALAGYTSAFGGGESDVWLIKVDEMGIPEFPSWTPLLIALVAVVAVAVIFRKKLSKSNKRGGNH